MLALLLLLLSDEALLGGLVAFALRVGAMAAPAGHACQGQLTLTGHKGRRELFSSSHPPHEFTRCRDSAHIRLLKS